MIKFNGKLLEILKKQKVRNELKAFIKNPSNPLNKRYIAKARLNKLVKPVRYVSQCVLTGRRKGKTLFSNLFQVNRICLRELIHKQYTPYIKKTN